LLTLLHTSGTCARSSSAGFRAGPGARPVLIFEGASAAGASPAVPAGGAGAAATAPPAAANGACAV